MVTEIDAKCKIIRKNKAFMIETLGKSENLTLNEAIDEEIALGVHRCNNKNNSKKLDKSKKGSWEYTY